MKPLVPIDPNIVGAKRYRRTQHLIDTSFENACGGQLGMITKISELAITKGRTMNCGMMSRSVESNLTLLKFRFDHRMGHAAGSANARGDAANAFADIPERKWV